MLKVRLYIGLLWFCSFYVAPAWGETITAEMRQEDARLATPVTFTAPRIQIGELLDRLSDITGVNLTADLRDGAADPKIAVFLRNMKLGDALDALWSLMSYRGATWHWRREGSPGNFTYTFTRPLKVRNLAGSLRDWVQETFEHETEVLIEAAHLTPKERQRNAEKIKNARYGQDYRMAGTGLPVLGRTWAGLRLFGEMVPPDVRKLVLRNQTRLRFPVSELSEEGRAFVRSVWEDSEAHRRLPDGSKVPVPEPSFVTFFVRSSDQRGGAPGLFIGLEGIGAYGYAGGISLKRVLRARTTALWMLPGDASEDPVEDRLCPKVKPVMSEKKGALETRLEELADGTLVSILAQLAGQDYADPGTPERRTVREFLANCLKDRPADITYKWRQGVLLLVNPSWIWHIEAIVPYGVVKSLREVREKEGGYVPFEVMVETTRDLSNDQLADLKEEFPVVESLVGLRGLLTLIAPTRNHLARLQSERGLPIGEEAVAAMRENLYFQHAFTAFGTPTALRITEKDAANAIPERRMIEFVIQTRDGKWHPVIEFANPKHGESAKPALATPAAPNPTR